MSGVLTLVATPIDDETSISIEAKELLLGAVDDGDMILVEELKEGRRRWLRFGLPKSSIDNFILYNEHTHKDACIEVVNALKAGKNAFLMSDCGLPAFCDPGRSVVEACHRSEIKVTATPFANSIALAVALSGFPHERFIFEGFIPAKSEPRMQALKRIIKQKEVSILMDTPYRMKKMVEELKSLNIKREVFLGIDLNKKSEILIRGSIKQVLKKMPEDKREFILILGPNE